MNMASGHYIIRRGIDKEILMAKTKKDQKISKLRKINLDGLVASWKERKTNTQKQLS